MTLFKDKYRVESARLESWDYSWPGWYFVTICTKGVECFFGRIADERVLRSRIGEIVAEEWQKTDRVRRNVELDEWEIMPNHLHGIIIIGEHPLVETTRRVVSTTLKPNCLGSIVGQFKSVCTKHIHGEGYTNFAWQPRFYDHIIRNEADLHRVRHYINTNILRWELDRNNPEIAGGRK